MPSESSEERLYSVDPLQLNECAIEFIREAFRLTVALRVEGREQKCVIHREQQNSLDDVDVNYFSIHDERLRVTELGENLLRGTGSCRHGKRDHLGSLECTFTMMR
ncbi:unnamed protein product [Toxocara canis]|uniref:Ras-associating domain-containing protein n=1 Tax=Toxocara canis TaxID=6265 RepID=A0A183TYT1_TOXCA|nr:unnamed protein product [Toxocara canis]